MPRDQWLSNTNIHTTEHTCGWIGMTPCSKVKYIEIYEFIIDNGCCQYSIVIFSDYKAL